MRLKALISTVALAFIWTAPTRAAGVIKIVNFTTGSVHAPNAYTASGSFSYWDEDPTTNNLITASDIRSLSFSVFPTYSMVPGSPLGGSFTLDLNNLPVGFSFSFKEFDFTNSSSPAAILAFNSGGYAGNDKVSIRGGYFFAGSRMATSASITSITAVPEPSSWALMVLGFGAVGGSMRQRRRQNTQVLFG